MSGRARGCGWGAWTKRAITTASIRSVLARLPSAWAKARTWAGLTTATGSLAAANPAATTVSNPPVASTATTRGACGRSRRINSSMPSAVRGTWNASPAGSTCTSRQALDTSTPTKLSIVSRPCKTGLAGRPKRLSGLNGTADGCPRSPTDCHVLGNTGIPTATAPATLADTAQKELQGSRSQSRGGSDRGAELCRGVSGARVAVS